MPASSSHNVAPDISRRLASSFCLFIFAWHECQKLLPPGHKGTKDFFLISFGGRQSKYSPYSPHSPHSPISPPIKIGLSLFSFGLLLEIGTIERFSSVKKLASFFGLHPVYKQSGDGTFKRRMSKKGTSLVAFQYC